MKTEDDFTGFLAWYVVDELKGFGFIVEKAELCIATFLKVFGKDEEFLRFISNWVIAERSA